MDGDALKNRNMNRENGPIKGGFDPETMKNAKARHDAFSIFGRKDGFDKRGNRSLDDSSLPPSVKAYLSRGDIYDHSVLEHPNDNIVDLQRYNLTNGKEDSFFYDKNDHHLWHKDSPFYEDGDYNQVDINEYGFGYPLNNESLRLMKAYGWDADEAKEYLTGRVGYSPEEAESIIGNYFGK